MRMWWTALLLLCLMGGAAGDDNSMGNELQVTWGEGRGKLAEGGRLLTLSLDRLSGSGFQSNAQYLFGRIHMQLKLVPGNSAGTVTAYYLSSQGPAHDEIDFEFLGNLTGEPYTLHTNVFSKGKGQREQQFRLWFDPAADFHTYSILWNPRNIIFYVDEVPIREFINMEVEGVGYPKEQPMKLYSSLWEADDWATQGGRVKTDWTQAPFTAAYRSFRADACVPSVAAPCTSLSSAWAAQVLDPAQRGNLQEVQRRYMIYDYCRDIRRFPGGLPAECSKNN